MHLVGDPADASRRNRDGENLEGLLLDLRYRVAPPDEKRRRTKYTRRGEK